MTTVADIRGWFEDASPEDTHMIVVCDTFDYEDYPVYVKKTQDVHEEVSKRNGVNMQRVMEVYDLSKDREAQLGEDFADNR